VFSLTVVASQGALVGGTSFIKTPGLVSSYGGRRLGQVEKKMKETRYRLLGGCKNPNQEWGQEQRQPVGSSVDGSRSGETPARRIIDDLQNDTRTADYQRLPDNE
jgi:hypothetical protein